MSHYPNYRISGMISGVVKKSELPPTSGTTRIISETTATLLKRRGYTQTKTAEAIGRSQSYVQTRWNGIQPWNTEDLEQIATKCLGLPNSFALIDIIRGTVSKEVM